MIFAPLKLLLVTSLVVAFTAFTINGNIGMHWWYLRSNHLELALRVILPALAWLLMMTLGFELHRMRSVAANRGALSALLGRTPGDGHPPPAQPPALDRSLGRNFQPAEKVQGF
jgi:hypothetical protein